MNETVRIEGKQIALRPITLEDTPLIVRWRSDPRVYGTLFRQEPITEERHRQWLREMVLSGKCDQFIIVDKAQNRSVGTVFLKEIDRAGIAAEQIVMISFHKEIVRLCKVLRPEIRVQWLTGFRTQEDGTVSPSQETILDTLKDVRADGLDAAAGRESCGRSLIRAVQDAGYAVNVWTIDEEETARFYLSAGVDFITSNRAAGLRDLFRGKDPER